MSVLKNLRVLARYEVLTPIVVLAALAASPVMAASSVRVDGGTSYTNDGTVDDVNGGPAIGDNGTGDIVAITNNGEVTAANNSGVGIEVFLGTFTNAGEISGVGGNTAFFGKGVGTFLNTATGKIQNTDALSGQYNGGAIGFQTDTLTGGAVGTFLNHGDILGATVNIPADLDDLAATVGFFSDDQNGSGTASQVSSFTNTGRIIGPGTGVSFNGGVATFVNSNIITSTMNSAINANGPVGTLTNSGTLKGAGYNTVSLNKGVASFINDGTIQNTDATLVNLGDFGGGAISFNTDTGTGGVVQSFVNRGTISGADQDDNNLRSTISFYSDNNGNNIAAQVGSFLNAGMIDGEGTGVSFDGGVNVFSNAAGGKITSALDNGVKANGIVGTFTNAGTITGANRGVHFDGMVTNFTNSAGGAISGTSNDGVYFNDAVINFTNNGAITTGDTNDAAVHFEGSIGSFRNTGTGTITGGVWGEGGGASVISFVNAGSITNTGNLTVDINGPVTSFVNTGTISAINANAAVNLAGGASTINNSGTITVAGAGAADAVFVGTGGTNLTNSGTLKGPNAFRSFGNFNDKVTLLTGSELYGIVNFGSGNDTLDFSGFYGTTVLQTQGFQVGTDTIIEGDRPWAEIGAGSGLIAIYDPTGATSMGSSVTSDLVGGIQSAITDGLSNTISFTESETESAFVAQRQPTSAEAAADEAVLSELDTAEVSGGQVWGKVFGGVSRDDAPVALSNVYGGIVAGSHFQLDAQTRLGGLGGYARSSFDVANGQQVITSDTGVLGVYGHTDLGVLDVTYSLLGGASGHSSTRKVVVGAVLETATASFSSWFLAPSLGVSLPVLSDDTTKVNVAASASYIFGGVSGYTETVSGGGGGSITVGGQSIGVFDARLELNGEKVVGSTEGGDVTIRGKVGVMLQANAGGSAMPITFSANGATGTTSFTAPGSTTVGAYAGMGLSAELTDNLDFDVGADGSARSDGTIALSAKAGLTGSF